MLKPLQSKGASLEMNHAEISKRKKDQQANIFGISSNM